MSLQLFLQFAYLITLHSAARESFHLLWLQCSFQTWPSSCIHHLKNSSFLLYSNFWIEGASTPYWWSYTTLSNLSPSLFKQIELLQRKSGAKLPSHPTIRQNTVSAATSCKCLNSGVFSFHDSIKQITMEARDMNTWEHLATAVSTLPGPIIPWHARFLWALF